MENSGQAKRRGYTLLLLLLCMVWCLNAFGDPNPVTQEARQTEIDVPLAPKFPLSRRLASLLLDKYELVADGAFHELPIHSSNESVNLRREDVAVSFQIDKVYKGEAHDSVTLLFTNDMLMVPGETESRYVKRRRVLAELWTVLKPLEEQRETLQRLYEVGEIDDREYSRELSRLNRRVAQLVDREGLHDTKLGGAVIGATSFYDNDGAVRPGEKYLIAVNRASNGVDTYFLDEYSLESFIIWGELRNDFLAVLNVPSP